MGEDEETTVDRLRAAQCLRNAHGHIAQAYARMDGEHAATPGHYHRVIRETLDAVDWMRRALESMDRLTGNETPS